MTNKPLSEPLAPIRVLGLPMTPYTEAQALARVDYLITSAKPSFFITANLNYAMLVDRDPSLIELNAQADFLLADGMPLVWWSRWCRHPLPERVAGSDLIYSLCERAADRNYRVYLLGAGPGIAEAAANNLRQRYPALQIVGTECPPFRPLTADEQQAQLDRINTAQPHLLFVAFGQPKGEWWIAQHLGQLRVPVSVQVGASLDFVAGRVARSPKWMQKTGLEWFFRLAQEPRRLFRRYWDNGLFLLQALFAARFRRERQRSPR